MGLLYYTFPMRGSHAAIRGVYLCKNIPPYRPVGLPHYPFPTRGSRAAIRGVYPCKDNIPTAQ